MNSESQNNPTSKQIPGISADAAVGKSSITVSKITRERVNDFAEEHNISHDDAITALLKFYQTRTRYNFTIEAAEVVSELQTIEQEMFTVLKLVFDLNEGVRRLVELKETGTAEAFEKAMIGR